MSLELHPIYVICAVFGITSLVFWLSIQLFSTRNSPIDWKGRIAVRKNIRGYESSSYWKQEAVSITSKISDFSQLFRFIDGEGLYLPSVGNTGVFWRTERKQTGSIYPLSERKWSEIWELTIQSENQPEKNMGVNRNSATFLNRFWENRESKSILGGENRRKSPYGSSLKFLFSVLANIGN